MGRIPAHFEGHSRTQTRADKPPVAPEDMVLEGKPPVAPEDMVLEGKPPVAPEDVVIR